MTTIPFPVTSSPGKVPHESAGRLINVYYEPLPPGARAAGVWRRAPGLRAWGTTPVTGFRGAVLVGSTLYAAFSGHIYSFTPGGGPGTHVGILAGTEKVTWARNNKTPTPDVIVCAPNTGLFLVTSSSVTSYNAGGVLPACNSVTEQDGYFHFTTGDGRVFASAINDTTVNASTFVSAEGKPDGLLRGVPFTEMYLCGPDSIEVWHDTAEASPAYPYSRVKVIPRGIIGRSAISGFENGMDKGILFVASDKCVYALNGYSPVKVSTPDIDRALTSYVDAGGDLNAIEMFPYVAGGHSCIVMTSPSWTWVYDLDTSSPSTPIWHERQSYLIANWRATGAIQAFGKWLCGDNLSGNLVEISEAARDEVGANLLYRIESGPVSAFPNRMQVPNAAFDIAQGVGIASGTDPTQTNPTAAFSYSDDAGLSWCMPRYRKLGRQGSVPGQVSLIKCGMTRVQGRRWRIDVSDAVDVELTGGDQQSVLRKA